ncbi:MAG: tRNA lysidine(34) synthetase TilS [Eubacteriales bacterium]|nr:tRNA lysidine(34) synthetase TilS [Eubacteriales bacterium]
MNDCTRRLMNESSLAACAITASDSVLVALSGGADSTALLLSLLELKNEGRIGGLFAAHLNHGIRGESALHDERFCEALCARLGVPLQTETCDAPAYAKSTGKTLEQAARELRYAFLERARASFGANLIATAHHADDQAETVLLHLLRGCGTGGLGGMKPRSGNLVRPFLETRKDAILAYLAQRGETYCVDETNAQNTAARNRIRIELMPALRAINPSVTQALCKTAALCAEDDALLRKLANEAGIRIAAGDGMDRNELTALPAALKSRIVRNRIFSLDENVNESEVRRVLALLTAQTGTRIELSGGFHAWTDATALYIGTYPEEIAYCVPFVPEGETVTPRGVLHSERSEGWHKSEDGYEAYLSLDTLPEGLVVRSRRKGDRFHPLGAPGERKLSDVFIDKKISKEKRDLPLLCAGNEVYYAAGLTVSERAKVGTDTREILHITFTGGNQG